MEEAVSDLREKRRMWQLKGVGGSWDFHFVEWWAGLLFPMSKQFGGSVYHRVRIQAVLRHLWTFINLPAHELHTGQRQRTSEVRGHVSASHHDSIYGILSSSSSESTGDQRTAEPRADERCNMNMNPLSRKSWRQRWSENIHHQGVRSLLLVISLDSISNKLLKSKSTPSLL